jgi:hypothetical protein
MAEDYLSEHGGVKWCEKVQKREREAIIIGNNCSPMSHQCDLGGQYIGLLGQLLQCR